MSTLLNGKQILNMYVNYKLACLYILCDINSTIQKPAQQFKDDFHHEL